MITVNETVKVNVETKQERTRTKKSSLVFGESVLANCLKSNCFYCLISKENEFEDAVNWNIVKGNIIGHSSGISYIVRMKTKDLITQEKKFDASFGDKSLCLGFKKLRRKETDGKLVGEIIVVTYFSVLEILSK